MAGGQEERVLKLRRAITAGGNLRPQAIGRLLHLAAGRRLRDRAPTAHTAAPRPFADSALVPARHPFCRASREAGEIHPPSGFAQSCARLCSESANCDSVLRDQPLAILWAWMMWRAKDAFGPPPSSAAFRVPDAQPKLYTFLEAQTFRSSSRASQSSCAPARRKI